MDEGVSAELLQAGPDAGIHGERLAEYLLGKLPGAGPSQPSGSFRPLWSAIGDAGDPPEWLEAASMPTWHQSFPTRAQVIECYGDRMGVSLENLLRYRVFGVFRLAVILQQIWIGYVRGERKKERFATFGQRVDALICKADRLRASYLSTYIMTVIHDARNPGMRCPRAARQ